MSRSAQASAKEWQRNGSFYVRISLMSSGVQPSPVGSVTRCRHRRLLSEPLTSATVVDMFDWTINEARRDKIAREVQKAITRTAGRRMPTGETLLYTPEAVEALLGIIASLLDRAPQCATQAGMDAVAKAVGDEMALLLRDMRSITGGTRQ